MMTARVQTDENDDAGVRPVMTALLRTSTEMPDEQAETGFLDGASLAHRLSDNECGQGELDSPEIRRSMVDRSVRRCLREASDGGTTEAEHRNT